VHLLLALIEDREGVIPAVLERLVCPRNGWRATCTRSRRNCLVWPEREPAGRLSQR
jgi:hypothetical protein